MDADKADKDDVDSDSYWVDGEAGNADVRLRLLSTDVDWGQLLTDVCWGMTRDDGERNSDLGLRKCGGVGMSGTDEVGE